MKTKPQTLPSRWQQFSKKLSKKYWVLPSVLFALSGALVGCHAQENKITPIAPASPIHTAADTQPSAPLVTGLPDFTKLADYVSPAVVNIRVSEKVPTQQIMDLRGHPICLIWPDIPGCSGRVAVPNSRNNAPVEREAGQGSGFITSQDGYVLTNHHVIDGASTITVVMQDEREFKATVVGSDARTDVALLKIDATGLPFLRMADSNKLKVGEWVVAAGSPFGLKNTITAGVVSAINRDTGDYLSFIQTDAAVNPGNSGGPLVNMSGEVVGINSQILTPSGAFSGIALAIPINDALQVAEQLRTNGKVERGRVGVGIENVNEQMAKELGLSKAQGVVIAQVEKDSPAAQAGLRVGDVVLKINGSTVESIRDFARFVGENKPGTRLQLEIWRDGHSEQKELVVGQSASR